MDKKDKIPAQIKNRAYCSVCGGKMNAYRIQKPTTFNPTNGEKIEGEFVFSWMCAYENHDRFDYPE